MPLMEWTPAYSVGIKQFDEDHQQLFRMINDLNDAMRAGRGKVVITSIFLELIAYTKRHFAAEETAMRRCGFEMYEQHCKEHRALTERARLLAADHEKGDTLISIDVLYFLRDWLENHTMRTDRAYAECLKKGGVSC